MPEARWSALPVVVTNAGGSHEAIDCNESGLLAADPSAGEIASLVGEFLNNSDKTSKAQRAGPRFDADRFGMDHVILENLALYGIDRLEAVQPEILGLFRESPC